MRGSFVDVIILDLHPSYSTLNQAIFDEADQILVPITPDVPAIRAAVQLRDVSYGLGCRERLAMVVNRANSGVSVEDMERTVGMPALAQIRSGGLLFVRAANEGRTVDRDVPAGEDHRGLRPPGRPRARDAAWQPGPEGRLPAARPDRGSRLTHAGRDDRRNLQRVSATGRSSSSRPSTNPAAADGARPS